MDKDQIAFMSVDEQGRLIESGELSPVDLVQLYLDRIERYDNVLHSWITVAGEQALAATKEAEKEIAAGNYKGPLHGIPFGVKDQMTTKSVRTTMASVIQDNFGPDEDATVVANLKAAGAILLGKNNMHEFGKGSSISFHYGEPKNPWNLEYEASHSSTGSGISVAAGLCSFSIGEDTGGSIRGPAWANGVVGIRPTYGRVSRHGGLMYAWTQDTFGPVTRTVADNALVMEAIAGHDPKDTLTSTRPVPNYQSTLDGDIKGIKLGLVKEMSTGQELHPDVEKSMNDALEVLRSLGAEIEEVSLPKAKYAVPLQMLTSDADGAAIFLENWFRTDWDRFDRGTRTRIGAAALIPAPIYNRAMRGRALVRNEILASFDKYDGLLALMNFIPPMKRGDSVEKLNSQDDVAQRMFKSRRICTYPFSVANVPALSVPTGFTDEDVPMSIQVVSKPYGEETVYRVAHAYEQATDWHSRHPDLEKTVIAAGGTS
ncbi:MAG: amidase [Rhodospirillaceae bacterium]|nr:amidase [Rhodospirillaceae bacterium]